MLLEKVEDIAAPKETLRTLLWRSVRTILYTALAIYIVSIFLIGNFKVTGPSMEGTLLEGDRVLVSKLHYGARIPRILQLPWIDHRNPLLEYLNLRLYSNPIIPYLRTGALSSLTRGDIVVFNLPMQEDTYEINEVINKRIVALPGDIISLEDGILYCNDQREVTDAVSFRHDLRTRKKLDAAGAKQWDIFDYRNQVRLIENPFTKEYFQYDIYTTGLGAQKIEKDTNVLKITRRESDNFSDFNAYPHWLPLHWNKDHFGKIMIPRKGLKLKMDADNIARYFPLIKNLEDNDRAEIRQGSLYIDDKPIAEYQFRKDYYFALGDNRDKSMDSRHWGFIPEDHIIGKVVLIYFSKDIYRNEIRWKRIFQSPQ
ncbi:signal peptidase I [Ohtaekwangia koreensis]|uniref:Signal peptidase I n=1 Tax=Ohtaekwangia koreensis TaxID=688867 RepID=A0A1T5KKK4_9BACT|nr:signal peptidase I [Ohtaekwangia koreensis]SKC64200.1 signal peptidase I [Ohtaekwangia koreensis]